jgi:biopolymer transport protein TolQ
MVQHLLGLAPAMPKDAGSTLALMTEGSAPVLMVVWSLVLGAVIAWALIVIKALQLGRMNRAERAWERAVEGAYDAAVVTETCRRHAGALGARLTDRVLDRMRGASNIDAALEQATTREGGPVHAYMTTLATIGATAPFVGLLGTVYGILDAFIRIGQAQSASLAVVGPAIGEALVATAIGLFAAIPAVIGYNYLSRNADSLLDRARANARYWAVTLAAYRS